MKKTFIAILLSASSFAAFSTPIERRLSYSCNEEDAWPDAGKSVRIFETPKGFHVDYVWFGMSGSIHLIERIACEEVPNAQLTATLQALYECTGDKFKIVLNGSTGAGSHASVGKIEANGTVVNDGRSYPCLPSMDHDL